MLLLKNQKHHSESNTQPSGYTHFPGGLPGKLVIGAFQLGPKHSHGKKIKFPGYSIFETWELCPAQIKDDSLVN
jgi:hypothetical protein